MKDTSKLLLTGIISGIAGIIIGVNAQKSVETMEKEKEAFSEKVDSDIERIRNEMSEAIKETGNPYKEDEKSEDE